MSSVGAPGRAAIAALVAVFVAFVALLIAGRVWPNGIKSAIVWIHHRFLPSLLFVAGLGIIGFTLSLWFVGDETTSSTVRVGSTGVAPPTTATGALTTFAQSSTVTDTPAAKRPSDALFGTFLGVGMALVLTGAFFYRITSIKFPGGELALTAQATAAVAKVTNQTEQGNFEAIKAAAAITAADLADRARIIGTSPSDDYAEEAAARARNLVFGPAAEEE